MAIAKDLFEKSFGQTADDKTYTYLGHPDYPEAESLIRAVLGWLILYRINSDVDLSLVSSAQLRVEPDQSQLHIKIPPQSTITVIEVNNGTFDYFIEFPESSGKVYGQCSFYMI